MFSPNTGCRVEGCFDASDMVISLVRRERRNNGATDKTTTQTTHTAPSLPHAGMGLSFFFRQYIHAGALFSIVSELRPLPVLATVLVSQGNIPESAHGLSVPIRRRPWPRDEPLSFSGTLATYVFRTVQVIQQ